MLKRDVGQILKNAKIEIEKKSKTEQANTAYIKMDLHCVPKLFSGL